MEQYFAFLANWSQIIFYLFLVSLVSAVLIIITYVVLYFSKKTLKEKFDHASENEAKWLLRSQYAVALSFFFFINTQENETVQLNIIWFFIRLFIGLCAATLHAYIAFLVFKYYYPKPLSKRLHRLRYTPRIHPKTGNKMKLLSEEEEDAYLDEGQQAEETVFSVDYDVWIDTKTGETVIEKYKGFLTAHECDRCGFQTLRLVKEEVIKEASEYWDGELHQEFKCSYCNRIKRKNVVLHKKVKRDISNAKLIDNPLDYDKRIEHIRIQIKGNKGEEKSFEFQNIMQAKSFLDEFDFEKLEDKY